MYVRGYLQGSENGRVVTIGGQKCQFHAIFNQKVKSNHAKLIKTIENCLNITLSNFHVTSSAIYTPNAYEVICRVARMAE
jgi:hypothetical protein